MQMPIGMREFFCAWIPLPDQSVWLGDVVARPTLIAYCALITQARHLVSRKHVSQHLFLCCCAITVGFSRFFTLLQ